MTTQAQRRYARRLTWIAAELLATAIFAVATWLITAGGMIAIFIVTWAVYSLASGEDKAPDYWVVWFFGGNVCAVFGRMIDDILSYKKGG